MRKRARVLSTQTTPEILNAFDFGAPAISGKTNERV